MSGFRSPTSETVWKLALTIVGYLILGIWMSAKISTGYDFIRADVHNLRMEVKSMSERLDRHIDREDKNK